MSYRKGFFSIGPVFRIKSPAPPRMNFRGFTESEEITSPEKSTILSGYFGRLYKLIPGEIVGLYLVGTGLADDRIILLIWFLFCCLALVFIRMKGTIDPNSDKQKPQWVAVLIAFVSFIIWVYTMGGPFIYIGKLIGFDIYKKNIGSLFVVGWTFIVPYFYKGDEE